MITLWRISGHDDLVGLGGEKAHGRWHRAERGKRIVYLSEHPALALIEVLANLKGDPRLFPDCYHLLKIAVPDSISRSVIDPGTLVSDWRDRLDSTQSLGDHWLARRDTALLAVPSAPSPESTNYLLNPLHPDAFSISILWTSTVTYDKRLFHLR